MGRPGFNLVEEMKKLLETPLGIYGTNLPGTGGTDITDVEKAEGYLAHKWGVTSLLPFDHPYKSSSP
jgi:hypothetical protein